MSVLPHADDWILEWTFAGWHSAGTRDWDGSRGTILHDPPSILVPIWKIVETVPLVPGKGTKRTNDHLGVGVGVGGAKVE